MVSFGYYNGMTMCKFTEWKDQEECEYSIKSRYKDVCLWMREDGTCSEPNVCADRVNR